MARDPYTHLSRACRLRSPLFALFALLVASSCHEERAAVPVPRDLAQTAWLPARVRDAITATVAGGEITRIEAVDDGHGGFRYQATISRTDGTHDRSVRLVTVAADGTMIGERPAPPPAADAAPAGPSLRPVDLAMLPEPARTTLLKHVLAADIKRIDQLGDGADAIFDVVAEHAGVVTHLQIDAAGRLRGGSAATYSMVRSRDHSGAAAQGLPESGRDEPLVAGSDEVPRAARVGDPETSAPMSAGFEVDADGHLVSTCRFVGGLTLGDVKIGMAVFQSLACSGIIRRVERMIGVEPDRYAGLVETQDRMLRIEVDRDGHVLSTRTVTGTLAVADLPAPVFTTVMARVGLEGIQRIEEQSEDGRVLYLVRLEGDEPPPDSHAVRRLVRR